MLKRFINLCVKFLRTPRGTHPRDVLLTVAAQLLIMTELTVRTCSVLDVSGKALHGIKSGEKFNSFSQ